jgi:hypothetical protein
MDESMEIGLLKKWTHVWTHRSWTMDEFEECKICTNQLHV